jgi:hypothetical protein
MSDYIQLGEVPYDVKIVKSGTRFYHNSEAYKGKRTIDVSKVPSDGWTDWWLLESSKPLPVTDDPCHPYPKVRSASFTDVSYDYGGPGQRFTKRASARRMGRWKVLVTQSGGLDI